MFKKLCISLIFSNLAVRKSLSPNLRMHNLLTKFAKILGICKQFSDNLVNERGNIPRRGPVPKFSDLEVVALSLAAEAESIDSENWLFGCRNTRTRSPTLFPAVSSMTAESSCPDCAKRYVGAWRERWPEVKISSLWIPSR